VVGRIAGRRVGKAVIVTRRLSFLLLVLIGLIGLAMLSDHIFHSDDYYLFIKTDVGGHGQGYVYYEDGLWTRRVPIGYDDEISLFYADLSPDGSKIAFKKDLWLSIYDLHSDELTQINLEPNIPLGSTTIQWSPDGSQIGFPCQRLYHDPIEVCAWDVANEEMRVLSDLRSYGKYDNLSFGSWSADAKTIVFTISYPGDDSRIGRQLILKLNTDDGHVSQVFDSQEAGLNLSDKIALSPDGKIILFAANTLLEQQVKGFRFSLYEINSNGSNLHRLIAFEDWSFFYPVWSPDGSSFYVNATNYYYSLPLRYDRSGRLIGILPFPSRRSILSWRSADPVK
jgi:Tol biopolymer transport system component